MRVRTRDYMVYTVKIQWKCSKTTINCTFTALWQSTGSRYAKVTVEVHWKLRNSIEKLNFWQWKYLQCQLKPNQAKAGLCTAVLSTLVYKNCPPPAHIRGVHLHSDFEMSSSKNLVGEPGFFVYFELDFCRLHRQ